MQNFNLPKSDEFIDNFNFNARIIRYRTFKDTSELLIEERWFHM